MCEWAQKAESYSLLSSELPRKLGREAFSLFKNGTNGPKFYGNTFF